jgi:hypothetical protein
MVMEEINGFWAIVSAIFGAGATLLTVWFKGRADMAAIIDQRVRMMLERGDDAISKLESRCEILERALIEERRECDEKLAEMRLEYREEIAILRRRVNDISEPEEM